MRKTVIILIAIVFFLIEDIHSQISSVISCEENETKLLTNTEINSLLKPNPFIADIEIFFEKNVQLYCSSIELDNIKGQAHALNQLAFCYYLKLDLEKAESLLSKSIEISRQLEYTIGKADFYCFMGLVQQQKGNNENAIYYFKSLLKLGAKTGNRRYISDAKINLGSIHLSGKNYDDAEKYFKEALEDHEILGNVESIGWCHTHLGTLNSELGNKKTAEYHFSQAEDIWTTGNMERGICHLWQTQGNTYLNTSPEKSLRFYKKAKECSISNGLEFMLISSQYHIGLLYSKKSMIDSAIVSFKNSHDLSVAKKNIDFLDETSQALLDIYKNEGDKINYLKYLELNQNYKKNKLEIKEVEYSHWLAADREIQRLESDNKIKELTNINQKNQNLNLIGWLSLLILSLVFFAWYGIQRKKVNKKLSYLNHNLKDNLIIIKDQSKKLEERNIELTNQKKKLSSQLLNKLSIIAHNQKNLELIIEKVKQVNIPSNDMKKIINTISNSYDKELLTKVGAELEEVHESFFNNIVKKHPNLTSNNLKLISYVKMNLTIKEIADLLFISPNSVKVARSRLRKKMKISDEVSLTSYIHGFN